MTLFLNGFGISGFRSFPAEMQFVGPLAKINVIIGENNSGKSNISRFVRKVLQPLICSPGKGMVIEQIDYPQGSSMATQYVPILVPKDRILRTLLHGQDHQTRDDLIWFLNVGQPQAPAGFHWSWFPVDQSSALSSDQIDIKKLQGAGPQTSRLWNRLCRSNGGSMEGHWIPGLLNRIAEVSRENFEVEFLSASRKLSSLMEEYREDYGSLDNGAAGLIETLAEYQHPHFQSQNLRKKFSDVEAFLKTVLRDDALKIDIPNNKKTIHVHHDGKVLPLEALGSGVHQAVIIAALATVGNKRIVCIEEPELHFHPELQRQLMNYLQNVTDNQYFITTHSAHVMDSVPCSVVEVRNVNGITKISMPMSSGEKRDVCHRLGYRPSDLLQANCVIWVEGPSDRIYLNYWLSVVDKELKEGWHYSVMFYGGKLLSNLSSDEDAVDHGLVDLLPINRFLAVLMDSDKKKKTDSIRATKARISEEVKKARGITWITMGREIENYIPRDILRDSVKIAHKSALDLRQKGGNPYDPPLDYRKADKTTANKNFDKVTIALEVVKRQPSMSILDLEDRVFEIAEFVRKANRMSTLRTKT